MALNQNSLHRKSVRLVRFDYTQPGGYFITIVTSERQTLLGEIIHGEMQVSGIGQIIQQEWFRLPQRFRSIHLDEFVIMPNHLHGIIIIADVDGRGTAVDAHNRILGKTRRAPTEGVTTREQFGKPVSGSIPTIIRSFKSSTTLRINYLRQTQHGTIWQRNYFEHVIRNDLELERIRAYIRDNPLNWSLDSENPDHK